jgi:hypothetical protein
MPSHHTKQTIDPLIVRAALLDEKIEMSDALLHEYITEITAIDALDKKGFWVGVRKLTALLVPPAKAILVTQSVFRAIGRESEIGTPQSA